MEEAQAEQQPEQQQGKEQAAGPAAAAAPAPAPAPAPEPAAQPARGSGRQRKAPEVFKPPFFKEKEDFKIQQGRGTKLADIPNVHHRLSKLKTEDEMLQALHQALYRRPGTAKARKRDVLAFSGFVFEDEAKEAEKARERLGKLSVTILNGMCDIFDVARGSGDEGKKEAKVQRLLDFLMRPKQLSDKDVAGAEAKKKEAAKRKRERAAKKKAAAPKKKAAGTKKKAKGEPEEEESEESEESEEAGKEEEEEPEEEPAKKKAKSPKKTPAKEKPAKREAKGKQQKKGKAEAAEEQEGEGEGEEMAQDEAPAPAEGAPESLKGTRPDSELQDAITDILKNPDSVSLKYVMRGLRERFTHEGAAEWLEARKDYIRERSIAAMGVPQPGAGDQAA